MATGCDHAGPSAAPLLAARGLGRSRETAIDPDMSVAGAASRRRTSILLALEPALGYGVAERHAACDLGVRERHVGVGGILRVRRPVGELLAHDVVPRLHDGL